MAINDKYACINCAHYEGNCGHHFRNSLGHIDYDCPHECEYDGRFVCDGPACFEPNEEQIRLEREKIIAELSKYSIDVLEETLSRLRKKGEINDD